MDSGYSRHMFRSRRWFRNLKPKYTRSVKFADEGKAKVTGIGNVGKNDSHQILDVLFIDGLAHNLLNIN